MHVVMKHWDFMYGIDFHMGYSPIATPPPAPPVPTGPYPFATMQFLSGLYIFFKPLWDQVTLYGVTVEKGTDIGSGIPHIPLLPPVGVIVELPLIIAFSGSKSHFSSSTYFVTNKNPALALLVTLNPNLNCGLPVPTPTGLTLCINTHVAGMSWGDIGAGLGSMFGDIVMQTALNLLGMRAGGPIGAWIAGKFGKVATGLFAYNAGNIATAIITFIWGSPVGGSSTNIFPVSLVDQKGDAWNPGTFFNGLESLGYEGMGRAVAEYLSGEPQTGPVPDIRYPTGVGGPVVSNM